MAIPVNIGKLITGQSVEPDRVAFFPDLEPLSVLHTVCAFANDLQNLGGGYIVLGAAAENGTAKLPVKGLTSGRIGGMLKELRALCRLIEPLYEPQAERVLYEGRHLIVLRCGGGFGRPYTAPEDPKRPRADRRCYIRALSDTVAASPQEEQDLFCVSSVIPFDDRPNLAARLEDLDLELIRDHLRKTDSPIAAQFDCKTLEDLADDLQLLDGSPGNRRPRNVGLLMFGSDPQRYFRYARIEVVDIPDATGDRMTEKIFTGTLQHQLSCALAYIKNYILAVRVIKHGDRAEADRIWNYPYPAVEEILTNAVCHRLYQVQEPITVRVTRTQMEITSFPGFERGITGADIEKGEIRGRVCRNRRIGGFLRELGMLGARNTGFANAYRSLKHNGSPRLQFRMDPERSYLTVIIPVHPEFIDRRAQGQNKYQERILEALGIQCLTLTELAKALGYKGISKKLRDNVNLMAAGGILESAPDAQKNLRYRKST